MFKWLLYTAIALVLVYVVFVLGVVSMPEIDQYLSRREFNSQQWKSWKESETELRLRWDMMDDLAKRYALVGMHRRDIIELLGAPGNDDGKSISYYLGPTYHGINTGSLTLRFNEQGVVTAFDVHDG